MMRVQKACLFQTIRFERTEDLEQYKAGLEGKQVIFRITDIRETGDGSVVIDIRRQYNAYDCGSYIDM